jgi:hypothetical protein
MGQNCATSWASFLSKARRFAFRKSPQIHRLETDERVSLAWVIRRTFP